MTIKEIYEEAKKLGAEDFEVEITINLAKDSDCWPNYRTYKIKGIDDIGYSDKILSLDGLNILEE